LQAKTNFDYTTRQLNTILRAFFPVRGEGSNYQTPYESGEDNDKT